MTETATVKETKIKISEPIHVWQIGDAEPRRYVVATLPFGKLHKVIMAYTFSAASGQGEQREQIDSHVKKLKSEMLGGTFTPTGFNGALQKAHLESLKERDGVATFELSETTPLRWVDGGHRIKAIIRIMEQFAELEDQTWAKALEQLPITTVIYLDGDPKDDFINLQAGRSVDRSHLLSLKIRQKEFSEEMNPIMKMAFNVATALNRKDSGSHISRWIKMDTKGSRGGALFPLSTIASPSTSTFATNVVGGAKIANHFKKSEDWLTSMYVSVYQLLEKKLPEALEGDKLLTPPPEGAIGQALMLLGVGNMMAFRCGVLQREKPSNDDIELLIKCVKSMLNSNMPEGSLGIETKRILIYQFAKVFLKDLGRRDGATVQLKFQEGLPTLLYQMIPPSAFNVKLPKATEDEAEESEDGEANAETDKKPKRTRKPRLVTSSG